MSANKEFSLIIKHNQVKRNQVTALHIMIGILLFMMGYVMWLMPNFFQIEQYAILMIGGMVYGLFGLILIIISIFFNRKIIQNPFYNQVLRILEILVLLSILIYSAYERWYLPVAYCTAALGLIVFAYFWERRAQKEQRIQLTSSGILIPLFFKKIKLHWQDISNIVLRHSILTIDCHDNKLYQFNVQGLKPENESPESFISTCKQWMEDSKDLPRNDW